MALSITILQPASLTATVDGASILAAVVGASATLNVEMGVPGPAATVQVGTTTTGDAGTDAEVVNVGTLSAAILDFTIPRGEQGIQGIPGQAGQTGAKGDKGDAGSAATINVGTTTTLSSTSPASVTNSGSTSAAIFNFGIPQGIQGIKGDKGDTGNAGSAATVNVGSTTTLSAGSSATVTNSGSTSAAVFNFGIPQGLKGDKGDTGSQGPAGSNGQGVSAGGTTGQALVKLSGTNYDTGWATITSGGGTWGSITGTLSSQTDLYNALNGKLSLSGGTMSGTIFLPSLRNLLNTDLTVTAYNDTGAGTNFVHTFDAFDGTFALATNGGGLKFPDATVQNTAGLPLTGGTMTGSIEVDGETINILFEAGNGINVYKISEETGVYISPDWVRFPDNTQQTTAYDPAVLSDYLPLTGGTLTGDITFPAVGIGNNSLIGTFGFGTENITLGQSARIEPNQISISSGTGVNFTNITPNNIVGGGYDSESDYTYAYNLTWSGVSGSSVGGQPTSWSLTSDGLSGSNYNNFPFNLSSSGVSGADDGGNTWSFGFSGLKFFSDGSVQTTAWLGYNGTTSQYIRGDGSLYTFPSIPVFPPAGGTTSQYITGTGTLVTFPPVGDRYLTSSTSTLTVDSGNGKTMTVGTGLSYSPQQDITVSYNTANHMHGTVLTYNSTTGVMTWDSNTHSGSGTYSSWEVNVGGVAGAILPVGGTAGQVLAKINSTNFNTEWISLGSMAQATTTDYLSKAGNLSGLASTSTARTNLGLGAVSTDAYATTAQAQAGTSTTTVVNPSTLLDAKYFQGGRYLTIGTWTAATSGAGAFGPATQGLFKNVFAPTSVVGYGLGYILNASCGRGVASANGTDFSKRTTVGGRFVKTTATADTNSVFRFTFGKAVAVGAGDLATRGIGFRQVANAALELQVHNGTTLYNITSTFTPTANQAYDVVIVSDGGTATMYVNGSSVATSANAPTSGIGTNVGTMQVEAQNTSALSGSAMSYSLSDLFVQTNL